MFAFQPNFYMFIHTRTHDYMHILTKPHPSTFLSSSPLFFCSSHSGNLFRIACESVLSHCRHMASLASEIEFWLCLSYFTISGTITVSKEMGCTQPAWVSHASLCRERQDHKIDSFIQIKKWNSSSSKDTEKLNMDNIYFICLFPNFLSWITLIN